MHGTHISHIGSFLEIGSHRIHYFAIGSGFPIVFLHGNSGFLQDFSLGVFRVLPEKWRAIAFDRPGYGYSDLFNPRAPSIDSQVELFSHAFDLLEISRPILVGHSWSGALVLAYALKYPDQVSAIVHLCGAAYPEVSLLNPILHFQKTALWGFLSFLGLHIPVLGWRSIHQSLINAFYPASVPQEYLSCVATYWLRYRQISTAVRELATLQFTLTRIQKLYHTISIPVTIVVGEYDRLVPPENHGMRLKNVIPQADFHIVRGAGHELHLSNPKALISVLEGLYSQLHNGNEPSRRDCDPISKQTKNK